MPRYEHWNRYWARTPSFVAENSIREIYRILAIDSHCPEYVSPSLDQSVESTLMVRFRNFRCTMMWCIHGMYAIEAAEWCTPEAQ
jgi:hypothetical protein